MSSLPSSVVVREELQRLTGGGLTATASLPQTDRHREPAEQPGIVRGAARYSILRPHALGGLGEVSLAHDNELNREVALKEIKEVYADDPHARDRFLREAQITGQLEHPGIVPVYGLETNSQGRPCYAMRFINGDTLKSAIAAFREPVSEKLTGGRLLEFRQLLGRIVAVCQAVHYAHSRGVLHRDIKPTNIMVGRYGETLVVDWGLAKVLGDVPGIDNAPARPAIEGDHSQTLVGTAVGTPAYMSPEQAVGNVDLGPTSDVYSLGATLYYLLTNRAPIGAELSSSAADELAVTEVLRRAAAGTFPRPSAVTGAVSPALEAVCLNAMFLAPEDRYNSAAQLAEDLERWLADEPVNAWHEPVTIRAQRWIRKRQTAVVSTVATLTIGLIAVAVLLGVTSRANRRLEVANHDLSEAVLLAREHNKLALDTLNYVVVEVQRELDGVPGTTELRHRLLEDVLKKLEHVSNKYQSQAAVDRGSFMALCDLGSLLAAGESSKASSVIMAASTYDRALSIARELAALQPDDVQARRDLANAWQRQGDVSLRTGRTSNAVGHYERSLAIRRQLAEGNPKFAEPLMELWTTLLHLGDASLQAGHFEPANVTSTKRSRSARDYKS